MKRICNPVLVRHAVRRRREILVLDSAVRDRAHDENGEQKHTLEGLGLISIGTPTDSSMDGLPLSIPGLPLLMPGLSNTLRDSRQ